MPRPVLKDILLSPHLSPKDVEGLLAPYGFRDTKKADSDLQLIADEPRARQLLAELIEELMENLVTSPDSNQTLNYLERFSKAALSKTLFLSYLKDSPHTLALLSKIFGSSPFMSEILIRNPNYLYWISDPKVLNGSCTKKDLERELSATLRKIKTRERRWNLLRVFKRKEMLRIGTRDLLKVCSLEETMEALTTLAEVVLQRTYHLCEDSLRPLYGYPTHRGSSGREVGSFFAILGMGKLGGGELNFSSDVDLIYLEHSDEGMTTGRGSGRIPNADYFKLLAQEITSAIGFMTPEGTLYRVDLRLRPEGKFGPIVYPMKNIRRYYDKHGETWERLSLLKARPVAGNLTLGKKFIQTLTPFIYRQPFEREKIHDIRKVKDRIDRKMLIQRQTRLNVKLGFGGIREIEFIVQAIQAFFGGQLPAIRERNTLKALKKLLSLRILKPEEYRYLSKAYRFLRDVEHKLQMVHELQTHTLPDEPDAMRECARRLDYRRKGDLDEGVLFQKDYRLHTERVNRIFRGVFYDPETSPILRAASNLLRHRKSARPGRKTLVRR